MRLTYCFIWMLLLSSAGVAGAAAPICPIPTEYLGQTFSATQRALTKKFGSETTHVDTGSCSNGELAVVTKTPALASCKVDGSPLIRVSATGFTKPDDTIHVFYVFDGYPLKTSALSKALNTGLLSVASSLPDVLKPVLSGGEYYVFGEGRFLLRVKREEGPETHRSLVHVFDLDAVARQEANITACLREHGLVP